MKSSRIGQRLGIGVGIGVVFLIAVGWLSLRGMAAMNASLQRIANEPAVVVGLTNEVLQRSIDNARITMQLFVVSGGPSEEQLLAQNLENTKLISAGMEKIEELLSNEKERALFNDVKTLRTPYLDSRAEVKKILAAGRRDAAIAMANDDMIPKLMVYRAAWNRLLAAQNDALNAAVAEGTARYQATRAMALSLIVLAALAATVIGAAVTRRIATPILDLTRTVERVSRERDYSLRAVRSTSDELGLLADGFNDMLGEIQKHNVALQEARDGLEEKVKERTHDLESANVRLGATNDELSAATARANETAEALRASEQRTRAILENMLGGLIMVDPQGLIELVNPAAERMIGYTSAELVGKYMGPLLSLPPGADPHVFLREVLGKSLGKVTELEGRRKNGEIFPLELSLFQVDTPEGRRFAGSIVDVTERRGVDRLKREFMSSISHELRTPLTSIRGSLGLLAGGVLGPLSAEAGEIVAVAERNAVRLIGLITDILDLERLEGGRLEMELESVETSPIVTRALEAVQSFADQAGVSLVALPASVRVRADADRLVQVLVNLLSNAVKFSPAGSTVTVRVVPGPSMAELQVEDRGRGVPPALREAIFERYRQVEGSDSRRKGGVGLGLAICKSIVEQHGGAIGVRDAEETGSLFWFRVPLAPSPRPSLSGSVQSARGLALLVDDDEELLSILELWLAQDRVATQRATTAREAIVAALALKPDVLVLDLGLPDGDGSQVVEALRRDKLLRNLPLLVYTGRDLLQGDRERLVLGPTRFLTKSRETDNEFRSAVLDLLARKRRKGDSA
jgi:PAS domain S-box-containing protein